MNELRIPLDPLNPGHFFACCGLLDLLGCGTPTVRAHFTCDEATPRRAHFIVTSAERIDLAGLLDSVRGGSYEVLPHDQKAIQPVAANLNGHRLVMDWWLDTFQEDTTPLKCWAGQVTTGKLFADLPPLIDVAADPDALFYSPALTRSKFGIDPRSAWNALDFGFSPDKHNRDSATYPIVEMLGAIGLQGFRPRPDTRDRRSLEYRLWSVPLHLSVARLAAFSGWPGLPSFRYRFSIAKRGQSYKFYTFAKFEERT
jgi:CRISPR-associated protein Csx14